MEEKEGAVPAVQVLPLSVSMAQGLQVAGSPEHPKALPQGRGKPSPTPAFPSPIPGKPSIAKLLRVYLLIHLQEDFQTRHLRVSNPARSYRPESLSQSLSAEASKRPRCSPEVQRCLFKTHVNLKILSLKNTQSPWWLAGVQIPIQGCSAMHE